MRKLKKSYGKETFDEWDKNQSKDLKPNVAGMPHSVGSITFNGDEHITLARLQSVCPPVAKRPHYQEGFLIGHFPIYTAQEALIKQSNLICRLVVKFKLQSKGDFWDKDFPRFAETALFPEDDPLLERFREESGPGSRAFSLCERAQKLAVYKED